MEKISSNVNDHCKATMIHEFHFEDFHDGMSIFKCKNCDIRVIELEDSQP